MSCLAISSRLIRVDSAGRQLIPVTILVLLCNICQGAFEYDPIGAQTAAMGGAFVAVVHGSGHPFGNPAGLPLGRGNMLCASFSRPFGIEDLAYGALAYSRRTSSGGWVMG